MENDGDSAVDPQATARTQARYERIAPIFDAMEVLSERRVRRWRTQLWAQVSGPEILEVGVGTGKNMPYYPADSHVTALDLTPGMLQRARRRAQALEVDVDIQLGDVQNLHFPDGHFDDAVATCVFCSVPDPVLGLRELGRVVKPDGDFFLLEHMRSANAVVGVLMDIMNPVAVRMSGANINRRTLENVELGGLQLERVEDAGYGGIFKLIVARRTPGVKSANAVTSTGRA